MNVNGMANKMIIKQKKVPKQQLQSHRQRHGE